MMGVREIINRNRSMAAVVLTVLILGAGWMVFSEAREIFSPPLFDQAFYTTDDGKTWFSDEKNKLPPFDTRSGTAVGAGVYQEGNRKYVAFLHRYTAETKTALETYEHEKAAGIKPKRLNLVMGADVTGKEVKKPGSANWVAINSPEGRAITTVVASKGGTAERVEP